MNLLDRLSELISVEPNDLRSLISTACYRYKVYPIPKRSGTGVRTIAQPAPEVKQLQRIVVRNVIATWPIHDAAVAYRKGSSIREHASRHVASKYLLKLDFEDFFPSITAADLEKHIQEYSDFSQEDAALLVGILTWRNKQTGNRCLSIGAPSSPFASNSVLFSLDKKLADHCEPLKVTYSRYADDLAFSTNEPNVLRQLQLDIDGIINGLNYPRLVLNTKKTNNLSTRFRRTLVGLNLTPEGKLSIGRAQKRELRAAMHSFSQGGLTDEQVGTLRGRLAYIWSVEPTYIATLLRKFGQVEFESLGLPFTLD